MTEISGTGFEEHGNYIVSWQARNFRDKFLEDITRFVLGPGPYIGSHPHNIPLSADDRHFFTVVIPKYIDDYVKYHTKSPPPYQTHNTYGMEQYLGGEDDPFNAPAIAQKHGQMSSVPSTEYTPRLGNIQHTLRDTPNQWPVEDYTGKTVVTGEKFPNNNIVRTTDATLTREGNTRFLSPNDPLYSHQPTGTENTDYNLGESSGARRGNKGKQQRPNHSLKSPYPGRAASTRPSEASKRSSQPDAKKHICQQCSRTFLFEARLKSHMAVHKASKDKLPCPDCGSMFGRESSLKRHQNTTGACEKKRQAKRRSPGPSSCLGSDGALADNNPPDHQLSPRMRSESNHVANNHASTSPSLAQGMQYIQQQHDRLPAHLYSQHYLVTGHNLSPQAQNQWLGIDPLIWAQDFEGLGGGNEGD